MKKILLLIGLILVITTVLLVYRHSDRTITQEKVTKEFNENIYYFNVVKEYLLTQPKDYYMNINTYSSDIEDIKVVEAVKYLVQNLKYKRIYNHVDPHNKENYYIVFLMDGNNNDEFGVIYTQSKGKYGMTMELIKDNWYFHWMGYN